MVTPDFNFQEFFLFVFLFVCLFFKFGGHMSIMGSLIPLFWTSGDVSSGFQGQSRQPYLHKVEAYMMYIL